MYLRTLTHMGLRLATREAILRRMPGELQTIAHECFGLDLQDPSELQVLPPQECGAVNGDQYVYWKLQDVLETGDRDFASAHALISASLVKLFRATEVPKGGIFTVRGCIPHIGTFHNVSEDLKPIVHKGTRVFAP